MELREFADLEAIHGDEIAAGYYTFPSTDSSAARDSQSALKDGFGLVFNKFNELFDESKNGELASHKEGAAIGAAASANPASANNVTVFTSERELARHAFQLTSTSYSAQALQAIAQQNSANRLWVAADARATYDQADIGFRRRRTEAARRIMAMKSIAYTEDDGPFNYRARMLPIKLRFEADFDNAMTRLSALRAGLSEIYHYDLDLKQSDTPFDDTLLAVRDAMEWLVRFSGQEQNYILPISIKAVVKEGWNAGLYPTETGGAWNFLIDSSLFPNQKHVRLRGLSATVVADNPDAIFQATIQVPQKASITYLDNTKFEPLDQKSVPVIRIGRIQQLNSIRAPDVVGTLSLHNVSPICYDDGRWRLAITSAQMPPSLGDDPKKAGAGVPNISEKTAKLKDVVLHLLLAVRTQ